MKEVVFDSAVSDIKAPHASSPHNPSYCIALRAEDYTPTTLADAAAEHVTTPTPRHADTFTHTNEQDESVNDNIGPKMITHILF